MGYASWSVVFGEQPSAAKWNTLGTNDASFNDGTGIAGLYKNLLTVDSNPYKFYAYRNAAYTASGAIVGFDSTLFDTNSNFNTTTNRYVAPVAGFYSFAGAAGVTSATAGGSHEVDIYKNGSKITAQNMWIQGNATFTNSLNANAFLQLAANDYIQLYHDGNSKAGNVGSATVYLAGFLVCRT